jgi:hypothetical protein
MQQSDYKGVSYDAVMQKMQNFVNNMLDRASVEGSVWVLGATYKPGDTVYPSLQDMWNEKLYVCRQEPFGDFCA